MAAASPLAFFFFGRNTFWGGKPATPGCHVISDVIIEKVRPISSFEFVMPLEGPLFTISASQPNFASQKPTNVNVKGYLEPKPRVFYFTGNGSVSVVYGLVVVAKGNYLGSKERKGRNYDNDPQLFVNEKLAML
ncbi:hypothetical protein HAX54_051420 [Datura stramonium]|uniref:Uncharacterized protein n=1 Tax=Datura stramonium TaxID=4076 RepID=A0ABS8SYK2_DATST|nr:hypothetical protein [Datura stramonium]